MYHRQTYFQKFILFLSKVGGPVSPRTPLKTAIYRADNWILFDWTGLTIGCNLNTICGTLHYPVDKNFF
jgi:hypothetical protein